MDWVIGVWTGYRLGYRVTDLLQTGFSGYGLGYRVTDWLRTGL